jgi:hypothetical protein
MANLRKVFLYNGPRDAPEFRRLLDERYGGRGVRLSQSAHKALADISLNFYNKVYPPSVETDATPFDFGNAAFLKDYLRETMKVGRAKGALPEYVFLGRAESGMYQTLHRLKARVHTSALVRKYL